LWKGKMMAKQTVVIRTQSGMMLPFEVW